MVGAGLSREILKWLQSLDLSYSVKNVKRDFANGFLIAEIYSRYYQHDVEMHSYDNGQALQRKLDNWSQLYKFFAKKEIKLDRDIINDVVHNKSAEAPVQLISTVYTQLTGREVRTRKMGQTGDVAATGLQDPAQELPGYARPNATSLLSANIRESEMTTTLEDQSVAQARAKALIDEHTATLRQDREQLDTRFSGTGGYAANTGTQRVLRGPPKPVSQELESTQVRFQEVKVRAVDRNIAQLRASRDQQLQGGVSYASQSDLASAAREVGPTSVTASAAELNGPGVLQLLSAHVVAAGQIGGAESALDAFNGFLQQLPMLRSDAALAVLESASTDADALAATCLGNPKQSWSIFHLIGSVLTSSDDPAVFSAACSLLCQVGRNMVAADAAVAEGLLRDFGLPRLLPLVKALPARAAELLQVVYAFTADSADAHINMIKALQEGLPDQSAFVMMLTSLITLEPSFTDDLLDLYVYYCVIALGMSSSRVRAAALSMLPVICAHNRSLVLQMLPRLEVLSSDTWWETQAQLGKLCCVLLGSAGGGEAEVPRVLALLEFVFKQRNPAVQSVLLSESAPLLTALPTLLAPFLSGLLALPRPQRALMLQSEGGVVPLPALSTAKYALTPLPARWPALLVAAELIRAAKEQQLAYLESAHAEVLVALLGALANPAEQAEWREWLLQAKDYLYVALCDEEICEAVASSLILIFSYLQEGALPTFSTLLSSLRMLFGQSGSQACQANALNLLNQLFDQGEPFSGAISSLVQNFDAPLRASQLSQLVARVEGQH